MIKQKLIWVILQEEILMDEDLMQVLPNYVDVRWNSVKDGCTVGAATPTNILTFFIW